jgi:MFS family permease
MQRGFAIRVLAYRASHDLIPLYSVYALLFTDSGLSVAQVSSLFVAWSVTAFVLEVPSGAWADTVNRRHLLVLGAAVHAAGFTSWVLWPSYTGFLLGFVLWGISGALISGTFESLLYDEMVARGQARHYARLVGWGHALAMTSNLVASVSAAPLLVLGGYDLVGWVSVAVCLVEVTLAATLPVTTQRPGDRHGSAGAAVHDAAAEAERRAARYLVMLRQGVREASRTVVVRRVVIVYAAVIGASVYDEYFPLVAAEHGAATSTIPWLIGLVVLGQVVGTALGGRSAGMGGPAMAVVLIASALLISAGALVDRPWIGFAGIAVGYGLLNNAMVVVEARLQDVISGSARATVTSVAGLATEVFALAVFAAFAATSAVLPVPVQVAALGVPLALVGLWTWARLPSSPGSDAGEEGGTGAT